MTRSRVAVVVAVTVAVAGLLLLPRLAPVVACAAGPVPGVGRGVIPQAPMRPYIKPGDVVLVSGVDTTTIDRGDVVAIDPRILDLGDSPIPPIVERVIGL